MAPVGKRSSVAAERRVLVWSASTSALMGATAMVWGVIASADVLIFDGVYTLASIALSGGSLLASRLALASPTSQFPFGISAAVPLAVVMQGAALAATLVFAVVSAVQTILHGGSPASETALLTYGLSSAAVSWLVVFWLRRLARGSDLADAEVVSWRAGAVLSLVVAAGGVVGLILQRTGHSLLGRYVDPVLVLVGVALIAGMPVRLIRAGMHELLEGAPPPAVMTRIEQAAHAAQQQFDLPRPIIRAAKLGRRLYVEVDFVVAHHVWDVDTEDDVRHAVLDRLEQLPFDVWASIELTTDEALAT